MADKALSPDILKLMDKIAKNPTSRLFVSLAEEYLKCDLPEEAAAVLVDGIKNHPTYVAARVMLGKIYFQKDQFPEAQTEFEQVISINPENILAHKKLAQIYQKKGQPQEAMESCRKALAIDPSDKEAKGLIALLEREAAAPSPEPAAPAEPGPSSGTSEVAEAAERAPETNSSPQGGDQPEVSFESASLERVTELSPPVEESPEQDLSAAPVPEVSESVSNLMEEAPPAFEPAPEFPGSSAEVAEVPPPARATDQTDDWGEKTVVAGFEIPVSEEVLAPPPAEQNVLSGGRQEDEVTSPTLASLYMSQGHYKEAIEVYEKLLMKDPSDEESRRGLEKALLKVPPQRDSAEEVAHLEPSDEKRKKMQRLQAWLDTIRKKE